MQNLPEYHNTDRIFPPENSWTLQDALRVARVGHGELGGKRVLEAWLVKYNKHAKVQTPPAEATLVAWRGHTGNSVGVWARFEEQPLDNKVVTSVFVDWYAWPVID